MSDWTRCRDCGESIYIDDAYCGHCMRNQKTEKVEGENDE